MNTVTYLKDELEKMNEKNQQLKAELRVCQHVNQNSFQLMKSTLLNIRWLGFLAINRVTRSKKSN